MEEGRSHPSSVSAAYSWMQFLLGWSTVCLVLVSMTVQVILVCGGAIRYRNGNRLLSFIIWVCYMGADFVATSALGAMIHYSIKERIYGIWACVLMVHLGGPDTITAYSIPDSNLWTRHCFNMLYQGSVAVYVMYISAVEIRAEIEWYLSGAASIILFVGINKYVERTMALRLASPAQIEISVKPVYNYMKIEHALGLNIDKNILDDQIADVDKYAELEEEIEKEEKNVKQEVKDVHYQYIVGGEECFDEDDDDGGWIESIVTIKDVWEHEKEKVTDNYLLCVSHALFKMYKRRFVSLRFHEAKLCKTERFFKKRDFNEIQVFNLVEMELKFFYDYLFTRSCGTAFSGWGIGMRMVNISLLGLCWFLIMRGLQETEHVSTGQRTVTYILMGVAVGLEGFQLCRIILSDWTMVWLICANIRQSRKPSSSSAKLIEGLAKVLERVRKKMGRKYWQDQVPQLCVIETCISASSYPLVTRLVRCLPFSEFIKRRYIRARTVCYVSRERLMDDSKSRVLEGWIPKDTRKNLFDMWRGQGRGLKLEPVQQEQVRKEQEQKGQEQTQQEEQEPKEQEQKRQEEEERERKRKEEQEREEQERKRQEEEERERKRKEREEQERKRREEEERERQWEPKPDPEEEWERERERELELELQREWQRQWERKPDPVGKREEEWERQREWQGQWERKPDTKEEREREQQLQPEPVDELPPEPEQPKPELQEQEILEWKWEWEQEKEWDHVILVWHVVTTILEHSTKKEIEQVKDKEKKEIEQVEDEEKTELEKNIGWSVMMSRYFAYLLVTCPDILPVDVETAKKVYTELFSHISGIAGTNTLIDFCKNDSNWGVESPTLEEAKKVVTEMLKIRSPEDRWKLLARRWLDILFKCAMYDKTAEHAKRVTAGGELLTMVWVLMGHMGRAEESYSASAMKMHPGLVQESSSDLQ